MISIHAPRVGSDATPSCGTTTEDYFNPRSPCGERLDGAPLVVRGWEFQSTLPVWGATRQPMMVPGSLRNFNPRSPCGERRGNCGRWPYNGAISIHAPRVGSDCGGKMPWKESTNDFNPRSPCGERQLIRCELSELLSISIHAPRVGSDSDLLPSKHRHRCISIHAPRVGSDSCLCDIGFQRPISIHAPRVGSDYFASTPNRFNAISIHAPRVGSDPDTLMIPISPGLFQSTLPVWGATSQQRFLHHRVRNFNPRSPCGERLLNPAESL